jgi:hypothetical protein
MRGSAGMVTRYKNRGIPAIMTAGSKVIHKTTGDKNHPLLVCIFCKHYLTHSEFDLDLHLYENHKPRLIKLPIGKGPMDVRIAYAIH